MHCSLYILYIPPLGFSLWLSMVVGYPVSCPLIGCTSGCCRVVQIFSLLEFQSEVTCHVIEPLGSSLWQVHTVTADSRSWRVFFSAGSIICRRVEDQAKCQVVSTRCQPNNPKRCNSRGGTSTKRGSVKWDRKGEIFQNKTLNKSRKYQTVTGTFILIVGVDIFILWSPQFSWLACWNHLEFHNWANSEEDLCDINESSRITNRPCCCCSVYLLTTVKV